MSWALLYACANPPPPGGGGAGGATTPTTAPPAALPTPTLLGPIPPPSCERAAGWDDQPGGRRMRLESGDWELGVPVTITLTGAVPGDAVQLQHGGFCSLECPPDRDGACLQPIDPTLLGEAVADVAGEAVFVVTPDATWRGWQVLQGVAPDAAAPYVSQAWVDHTGVIRDEVERYGIVHPLSPATVRHRWLDSNVDELWAGSFAPGRRVAITYERHGGSGVWEADDESRLYATTGSVTERIFGIGGFDRWVPGPSGIVLSFGFDYGDETFSFDLTTVPLDAPVDWFPDADGDGFGDPSGVPVASTDPLAGRSPDAGDCDDGDSRAHPLGLEICGDGLDRDCDGFDRPCADDPSAPFVEGAAGSRVTGDALSWNGGWLATADTDGDGTTELLAASRAVPLDRSDHDLRDGVSLGGAVDGVGADLTGDGVEDLALATFLGWDGATVEVFAGPYEPEDQPVATLAPRWWSWGSAAAGDVDGDGQQDLVVVQSNGMSQGETALYLGPLTGQDLLPDGSVPVTLGDQRALATVVDADGDGVSDLWSSEACLYLGPIPLAGAAPVSCADGTRDQYPGYGGMDAGDLDGDGLGDVVVGGVGAAWVLSGVPADGPIGDVAWQTAVGDDERSVTRDVAVIPDSDGDGDSAVGVVWHQPNWYGAPDAVWAWTVDAAPGVALQADGRTLIERADYQLGAIHGGDFDRDGRGDVAIGVAEADWGPALGSGMVWIFWGE